MAKSGQRDTHPQIIDKPDLKSPLRYLFEGSITFALWALWIYWILPLVTLVLWIMGFRLFYHELFSQGGLEEFIYTLKNGGLIILIISLMMLGWTYYNYLWFLRRGERRNKYEAITLDKDIAEHFKVDIELLKKLKQENRIEVKLDNNQRVIPQAPFTHSRVSNSET